MTTVAFFFFTAFLTALVWLALAAMSFWVWTGTKSKASLMTLIGAAVIGVTDLLGAFNVSMDIYWLGIVGAALVAFGYYMTVKPVVDAHVAALKAKAKAATAHSTTSAPPPAAKPNP